MVEKARKIAQEALRICRDTGSQNEFVDGAWCHTVFDPFGNGVFITHPDGSDSVILFDPATWELEGEDNA